MRRLRRVGLVVLLLALAGASLGSASWDGCNLYWNSTLVSSWEGTYCGRTGPGCEECYRLNGDYCVARLPDRCGIAPQSPTRPSV